MVLNVEHRYDSEKPTAGLNPYIIMVGFNGILGTG